MRPTTQQIVLGLPRFEIETRGSLAALLHAAPAGTFVVLRGAAAAAKRA